MVGAFTAIGIAAVGSLLLAQEVAKAAKVADCNLKVSKELASMTQSLTTAGSGLLPAAVAAAVKAAAAGAQAASPDLPLTALDNAHNVTMIDGVMLEVAQHIHLVAAKSPKVPIDNTPSTIYINAAGLGSGDGVVLINATKGITLTSGGAYLGLVNNAGANGNLTLQCGPLGTITLSPLGTQNIGVDEFIKLGPTSIQIDGGAKSSVMLGAGPSAGGCQVRMSPDPSVGISLICGLHSIGITQSGITIDGLIVKIKGKGQVSINSG